MDAALLEICPHFSKAKREEIADQSIRVKHAIERVATTKVIQESFKIVGQVRPNFLEAKMKLCRGTSITVAEADAMRSAFPTLVQYAKDNGGAAIPEELMDALGIMKAANSTISLRYLNPHEIAI